mmetsp:Transcript_57918/g.104024  ORF Transcript_57918/g.104024 Transcript_57918/m.104024 type:complete len:212 (-) Transcript_57918:102-737(-)
MRHSWAPRTWMTRSPASASRASRTCWVPWSSAWKQHPGAWKSPRAPSPERLRSRGGVLRRRRWRRWCVARWRPWPWPWPSSSGTRRLSMSSRSAAKSGRRCEASCARRRSSSRARWRSSRGRWTRASAASSRAWTRSSPPAPLLAAARRRRRGRAGASRVRRRPTAAERSEREPRADRHLGMPKGILCKRSKRCNLFGFSLRGVAFWALSV